MDDKMNDVVDEVQKRLGEEACSIIIIINMLYKFIKIYLYNYY